MDEPCVGVFCITLGLHCNTSPRRNCTECTVQWLRGQTVADVFDWAKNIAPPVAQPIVTVPIPDKRGWVSHAHEADS